MAETVDKSELKNKYAFRVFCFDGLLSVKLFPIFRGVPPGTFWRTWRPSSWTRDSFRATLSRHPHSRAIWNKLRINFTHGD